MPTSQERQAVVDDVPDGEFELKKLHRMGEHPAVVTLTPDDGEPVRVAVDAEHRAALLGPYASPVAAG